MTPAKYKTERAKRGTQSQVAKLLGVHPMTISRRENGGLPIYKETELALLSLPEKNSK